MSRPFWEKPLDALSDDEWEQLCDGCAQCCLIKLQDEDTDEIFATDVVCRYLDTACGDCGVYAQRAIKKPECFVIERGNAEHFSWLPPSCAYRLRFAGKPLFDWHPLICHSRTPMIEAGVAVDNWCVSETEVDEQDLTEHLIFSLHGKA